VKYPSVIGEIETLDLVLAGRSIARYGDGEFNLVRGGNCVSQKNTPEIREELSGILHLPDDRCLVGIPRLDPRSPKDVNWRKLSAVYAPLLMPKKKYYSAFLSRPDSAPWIATDEYFDKIESLWRNKEITMVYGSERSLSREFPAMKSALSIEHVGTTYRDAYKEIDRIEQDVVRYGRNIVLLMCGPTATCLAVRLSKRGFHAIDLGHIGMFWRPQHNPKLAKILRIIP
jgi:hypothetical protein